MDIIEFNQGYFHTGLMTIVDCFEGWRLMINANQLNHGKFFIIIHKEHSMT